MYISYNITSSDRQAAPPESAFADPVKMLDEFQKNHRLSTKNTPLAAYRLSKLEVYFELIVGEIVVKSPCE